MGGEYLGYRPCMQSIVLSAFNYSLYFQEPVEIRVGSAYHATQFSGSKREKILKTDTFQYIPIEETLKRVLQMPDIVNEINYFHGSNQRASEASELSPCSCQLRFQIRIYIYICGRTSNHMRMLNNSLLGNDIIAMKRYKVKTKVSIRLSIAIQYL